MANTYSQIYIHIVFAVKGRQSLINPSHNDELQKYITGVLKNKGHKMLAINNEPDHVHLFASLKPSESISDLVRDIKVNSSRMITEKEWAKLDFSWQTGFGAFSYAKSQLDDVVRYIMNQHEHHRKRTFREEWLELLTRFDIPFEEQYLFQFVPQQEIQTFLKEASGADNTRGI